MDIELCLRNGEGHGSTCSKRPGSLALRCFSCPQPDFNLPKNWKTDNACVLTVQACDILLTPNRPQWLYQPVLCADGNFHAEKMFMKVPGNDVALHDGEGFVVESACYKSHLEARKDNKQPVQWNCIRLILWLTLFRNQCAQTTRQLIWHQANVKHC